ncbi:MAG: hypothetical protein IPK72_08860 [Candidatus Eisenbacteria bacterium]|nr:hypothetical protein [Candidatus Eisenbacteria bacterium]
MTVLQEGELEFDFAGAVSATRFDDSSHGLSHCMKAVDFVVEFDSFRLFVEVKDPDHTQATSAARAPFAQDLQADRLTNALTTKYRDSWVYQWAASSSTKPIRYVVLLQLATLQPPALQTLRDKLRKHVPVARAPSWTRTIVDDVLVMDIATWNAVGDFGTVRRK